MKCKEYKYNIYYIIHRMNQEDRNKALNEIPNICFVTKRTFINWMYIKQDSNREVYQSCLIKIAQYLGVNVGELFNHKELCSN